MNEHRHHGFPTGAIILILLGIIFLLNNLGWLPWGLWGNLWRLWPLILIIIGLNIVFGRSHPWLVAAVTVLIVAIAVGIAAYYTGPAGNKVSGFSEPLGSTTSAEVDASFGGGVLHIDSLRATSNNLAEGNASQPSGYVSDSLSLRGGRAVLKVEGGLRNSGPNTGGTWWLHLTPLIPLDLRLKTGASSATLDLSQLHVGNLRLDVGASSVNMTLPANAGTTEATIKVGAASVDITVPQGVAARVKAQTGLGSFNIDQGRFPRSGDYYMSPDYNTAVNRVNIDVNSGAASIRIH